MEAVAARFPETKNIVLKIFTKFARKHLCDGVLFCKNYF